MNNSYTKKPITVKAFDFLKTKVDDKGKCLYDGIEKREDGKEWHFINTLEGKHYIKEDDFIIFGIKGKKYPCKREIFFATYQKEDLIKHLEDVSCPYCGSDRIADIEDNRYYHCGACHSQYAPTIINQNITFPVWRK